MASGADILIDGFERIRSTSRSAASGLGRDILEARVDPQSNTIAWLLWHLARGQDAQVADLMGEDQVWTSDAFFDAFNLDLPVDSTGYAHTPDDVAKVSGLAADQYLSYIDAVCDRSIVYLRTLSDSDLDDVIDERFTPPVTRGVRLFSVISDDLQHAGQAAILRGILERRASA